MITDIKRHPKAYVLLVVFLFTSIVLFLHAWPNRDQQRLVAIGLGVFYFLWGVVVHRKHNHISGRVVFEYLGVATLASTLLLLLLQ